MPPKLSASDQRRMAASLKRTGEALKNRPAQQPLTKKFKGAPPSKDSDDESDSGKSASSVGSHQSGGPGVVADHIELDWPGTVLLIGKKFSGKTNAILAFLREHKNYFDNVYVITTTKHKNNLNELVIDVNDPDPPEKQIQEKVLESLSEPFLESLIQHQKDTDAKTLLIFDDFIGIKGIKLKHSPNMKLLASSGRNFNISMVFSTQDAVEMMTTFRRNGEYLLIGDNDEDAIDLMAKTMASAVIPKQMMRQKIMDAAMNEYQFLYVDKRKKKNYRVKFPLVKD